MNVETLTATIVDKMPEVGNWQRKFLLHLFRLWLSIRGRYNFLNLARYGDLNEATYRANFRQKLDWLAFNFELIKAQTGVDRIAVFDPSYLSKSGKKTPGLGYFWSGCDAKSKRGLEIGALSIVDIGTQTAYHLQAKQTEKTAEKERGALMKQYIEQIGEAAPTVKKLTEYLVADAFFAKKGFVEQVLASQMHFITRLRGDAVLFYPYLGLPASGKGRPRKLAGRVDLKNLFEEHFKPCLKEDGVIAFEAQIWIKAWKRLAKIVVVRQLHADGSTASTKIYASTKLEQDGAEVLLFYRSRFQAEFLFRDAKQHTGLADCQSRQTEALDFHFNTALTAVSMAKVVQKNDPKTDQNAPFSIQNIKNRFFNELLLEQFFVVFGIDPKIAKIDFGYQSLLNLGRIAA